MKTNVAFCPHFHQPHFQLYNTREEVFHNCYLPWLDLLEEIADIPGFYINLHFSGPLLAWLVQEKPAYLQRLRALFLKKGIGLVGGLADEAFAQLSARLDDIMYQVQEYANLTARFLGINARDWEGIHVVEREAGEWALYHLALAAHTLGAVPLFYLDAESFFEGHFSYPGGLYDYCRQHFGFNDSYSQTTVSHLPPELLYYALRDEIGGQEFFVLPVHTGSRYRLLKKKAFGVEDRTVIEPHHYLFYLQDVAEQAQEAARRLGKNLEPIIVIFEDAEKFGQWSNDPRGDAGWLKEFFQLVVKDPNLQFCGLKSYFEQQGFLETYPAASSRSYPEWENWTARRGIRGVTFGDEKLRKLMSRQRDLEHRVQLIDRALLQGWDIPGISKGLLRDLVLDSPHRFKLIMEILSDQYPEDLRRSYQVIQRIRNVAYQEDPRWASRHPAYGSGSYFDLQALAYLELAERLTEKFLSRLDGNRIVYPEVTLRDWDNDGEDEIVVRTAQQFVVIHIRRGQVVFQQAVADMNWDYKKLLHYLEQDMLVPRSYPTVLNISQALVFTETDSELKVEYYPEGGRVERCRNSLAEVLVDREGRNVASNGGAAGYILNGVEVVDNKVIVNLQQHVNLENRAGNEPVIINKTLSVEVAALKVEWLVESSQADGEGIHLVPELVTSAVPSDPVNFKPCSWLGIRGRERVIPFEIIGSQSDKPNGGLEAEAGLGSDFLVSDDGEEGTGFVRFCLPEPQCIAYNYKIQNGQGEESSNSLYWELSSDCEIARVLITPAVKHYYQGYVFPSHSRLGYDSSGLMIRPHIPLVKGQSSFTVRWHWRLGEGVKKDDYPVIVSLLGDEQRPST